MITLPINTLLHDKREAQLQKSYETQIPCLIEDAALVTNPTIPTNPIQLTCKNASRRFAMPCRPGVGKQICAHCRTALSAAQLLHQTAKSD